MNLSRQWSAQELRQLNMAQINIAMEMQICMSKPVDLRLLKKNASEDQLICSWRWCVWLDHKMHEGSVRNGAQARETCERLLAEYQQAQMMQQ
jgi:hypothetical protein